MVEADWKRHSLDEVETCPREEAVVSFGPQKLEEVGQVLTPTIVQDQPQIQWTAEDCNLYTVFMTDPDAPSRAKPSKREWFHWGVINVPGCDISKGEVFAPYIGAGPPPNTGLHRYIILIYKQSGKVEYKDKKFALSTEGRGNQKAKDIAAKLGVGSPIAGACFQAEFDDYVPKLYAKLG